jgi:hypothetical protein
VSGLRHNAELLASLTVLSNLQELTFHTVDQPLVVLLDVCQLTGLKRLVLLGSSATQ